MERFVILCPPSLLPEDQMDDATEVFLNVILKRAASSWWNGPGQLCEKEINFNLATVLTFQKQPN